MITKKVHSGGVGYNHSCEDGLFILKAERSDEYECSQTRVVMTAEQLTQTVTGLLRLLSDKQREDFFSDLRSEFCQYCGREQPDGRCCQCMNDE
jgi:hypothetical protein